MADVELMDPLSVEYAGVYDLYAVRIGSYRPYDYGAMWAFDTEDVVIQAMKHWPDHPNAEDENQVMWEILDDIGDNFDSHEEAEDRALDLIERYYYHFGDGYLWARDIISVEKIHPSKNLYWDVLFASIEDLEIPEIVWRDPELLAKLVVSARKYNKRDAFNDLIRGARAEGHPHVLVAIDKALEETASRNPKDLKGRHIPSRYLKGLRGKAREKRIRELTRLRDGEIEVPSTNELARQKGLVKESSYTREAKRRGIEHRGNFSDTARRALKYYGSPRRKSTVRRVANALKDVFNKGLAAWQTGGHRPGASKAAWAYARVNSILVGGKTYFTADKGEARAFPPKMRSGIESRVSRSNPNYKWMNLSAIEPFIPLMEKRGVSKVARSYRGFLTAYQKAGGDPRRIGMTHPDTPNRDPYPWAKRREEFVARHMGQVKNRGEKLWDSKGDPTNRHLGLIAWAFTPDPDGVIDWINQNAPKQRAQARRNPDKTYAQLERDLRKLGHGVLGIFFAESTLKSCVSTAPSVQMALLEMGHTVGDRGRGREGHFDLSVRTSDRGWIHVDPTYMQFHCRYSSDAETDAEYIQDLDTLFRYFQRGIEDPLTVFQVGPLGSSTAPRLTQYSPPNKMWVKLYGPTWLDFFEKKAQRLSDVYTGKRKRWMRSSIYASAFQQWADQNASR